MFRLRVWQLVPPIARSKSARRWTLLLHPREHNAASKTGIFDESLILCDVPLYAKLAPLLGRLVHGRQPDDPLVQMPRQKVLQLVQRAAKVVGAGQLSPVLHSLRHGGPSTDLAMRARSLEEAQKRGRWRTFRSVARYERGAAWRSSCSACSLLCSRPCSLPSAACGRSSRADEDCDFFANTLASG